MYEFAASPHAIQWSRYRSDLGNTGLYHPPDCNGNGASDIREINNGTSRDCNANRIPDECDPPGDADGDGDVTLADYAPLHAALFGPGQAVPCAAGDHDRDGDVDLWDYRILQIAVGR